MASSKAYFDSFSVQESDGNFFESFTALSWRQENKRLRATSEVSECFNLSNFNCCKSGNLCII